MGNNHDKYFGDDKRKILLLGIESAGKTTLLNYIINKKASFDTIKTKNLNIEDVKIGQLQVSFFDLAGGQRQRIFWKQQFQGTQGIIFVMSSSQKSLEKIKSIEELQKLYKNFNLSIPFAICLTKIDQVQPIQWNSLKSQIQNQFGHKRLQVFPIDYKNSESIQSMLSWFLKETKPI